MERLNKKGKQKHNNDEDFLKIKANKKLLKTKNWAPQKNKAQKLAKHEKKNLSNSVKIALIFDFSQDRTISKISCRIKIYWLLKNNNDI